jgi:hypothetical protein
MWIFLAAEHFLSVHYTKPNFYLVIRCKLITPGVQQCKQIKRAHYIMTDWVKFHLLNERLRNSHLKICNCEYDWLIIINLFSAWRLRWHGLKWDSDRCFRSVNRFRTDTVLVMRLLIIDTCIGRSSRSYTMQVLCVRLMWTMATHSTRKWEMPNSLSSTSFLVSCIITKGNWVIVLVTAVNLESLLVKQSKANHKYM